MKKAHAQDRAPMLPAPWWLPCVAILLAVAHAVLLLPAASLLSTSQQRLAGVAAALLLLLFFGVLQWRLARLQGELYAERQHKANLERHSREMYRQLERKLEERTAQMTQERDILVRTEKLAALSRLVAGVAHELNNPLMAILGEATLLREHGAALAQLRGLETIEQQARRCASLVRDLEAFASLEQRKVQILDAHALLDSALAQVAADLPGSLVQVVRQYWPTPLIVQGNMEQLQQALVQIISNAYQALEQRPDPQLTLRSARTDEGQVRLQVADNGPGIEPEILPYIFDPFFSRRLSPSPLRVGLGLSVALGLVQAHGGRIWAESQPGQGTLVTVELPEAQLAPAEAEAHAPAGQHQS